MRKSYLEATVVTTLYNTSARVFELTGMQVDDFILQGSPAVRISGQGRKERTVPLWANTASQLRGWLREFCTGAGG